MAIAHFHEFASRDDLVTRLADDVLHHLANGDNRTLAVSGGGTPKNLFRHLSNRDFDWPSVSIIPVDERNVPPDHERSNERMIRELLIQNKAAGAGFHPLRSEDTPEGVFDMVSGLGLPPSVCLLGMGNDGHTASWFPKADRLAEAVDPHTGQTAIAIEAPGAGEPRFTLTYPVVVHSGFLALHIEGAEKRDAFEVAEGTGPSEDMPIRYLLRDPAVALHVYWAA